MECYKKLIPVIITADHYLQMNTLSNEQIEQREKTTVYHSINRPLCNYVSFEQTSPFLPFGQLSSLFDQPGISVIQFLTPQLYYRINWKITNNSGKNLGQRVRFLTVDVEKQIAPEPWDIRGNRICFITPCIGQTTRGCFSVPGEYLYFVIEDSGKNLDIELTVTGYFPKINNWAIYGGNKSDFCIRGKYVYTNRASSLTRIQRILNPEFLPFQERILEEYYRNAGQPCFLPSHPIQVFAEETVQVTAEYDANSNKSQPNSCSENGCCGSSYIEISVKISPQTNWISSSKDLSTVFILKGGRRYTISNMLTSGERPDNSPYAVCDPSQYAFLLYPKDSEKQPQTFIPEKSNPPDLSPDADNRISVLVSPDNLTMSNPIGKTLVFDTLGSSNTDTFPYTIRLNSSLWRNNPDFDYITVYRPKSFKLTFDLTIFLPI